MNDVIELLRSAKTGSRGLDAAIAEYLIADVQDLMVVADCAGFDYAFRHYVAQGLRPTYRRVPDYTTSVDAALTVVPDDQVDLIFSVVMWTKGAPNFRAPAAKILRYYRDEAAEGGWAIDGDDEAKSATPALAVCLAAMLARWSLA